MNVPIGDLLPDVVEVGLPELLPEQRPATSRRRRGRQVILWLAVAWIAAVVLGALLADVLPIHRYDQAIAGVRPRTGPRLSWTEPLGTDVIGRSQLSRIIYGARQSLLIGVCSVSIAMTFGLVIGTAAGYFRGRFDSLVRMFLDAVASLPGIVVLLAVASVGRRDVTTLVEGLSVIFIPQFARLARANTLALAERESVQAARSLGATHARVIRRELLPEVVLRVSSYAFLILAGVMVLEGTLSFLGVGIPPPSPSWGGMVNDGRRYLDAHPHLVFIPSAALFLTVVSFTIIGDHLRRRFDHRRSALA